MVGMEALKGFRTLSAAERELIAAATREQTVAAGKLLLSEGEPAEALWAVKDGLIHIIKFGPDGREIVLEVIPPGELFGAVVALQNRPYPASAIAAEPSVVWSIPASLARDLCQKHPTLRSTILDQVTTRLRGAHERLRSIALERVEQRLARMLFMLADKNRAAERNGDGTEYHPPGTCRHDRDHRGDHHPDHQQMAAGRDHQLVSQPDRLGRSGKAPKNRDRIAAARFPAVLPAPGNCLRPWQSGHRWRRSGVQS
jgi:CRP-like cAMP-binding protein